MSSLDDVALTTLGLMNECVMSVYGISRLLKSRDLGPTQLVPAIVAFREEAAGHCVSMDPLFDALRDAADGQAGVMAAVNAFEPTARNVADEVMSAFDGPLKLGAHQRLQLERSAERLGAELEAVRALAEVLYATLHAKPVYLTLFDLLHGRWHSSPNFVTQRLDVLLEPTEAPGFSVEPRVLRALLEHALSSVAAAGVERCHVSARAAGDVVVFNVCAPPDGAQIEPVELGMGLSLPVHGVVLDAAASRHGIERDVSSPQRHTLRLAADGGEC